VSTATVQLKNGGNVVAEVAADVVGFIAVHRSRPAEFRAWTLTHVPTGCAIARAHTEADAGELRAALLPHDARWNFSDPEAARPLAAVVGPVIAAAYERDSLDDAEDAEELRATTTNRHTKERREFTYTLAELRGVVMGDADDECTGPCACSPLEPDGTCSKGWPSRCRAAGLI